MFDGAVDIGVIFFAVILEVEIMSAEVKNTRSGASPAWCFLAFSWIVDVSTAAMRRCVLLADVRCGVVVSVVASR